MNKRYTITLILSVYIALTLVMTLFAIDFNFKNSLFFLLSSLLFAFGSSLGSIAYLKSAMLILLVLGSVIFLNSVTLNNLTYRDIAVFWGFIVAIANLFLIIIAITKGTIKNCFTIIAGSLMFFIPLLFWSYYFAETAFFNPEAFIAVSQTNTRESYEYILSHLNFKIILSLIIIVSIFGVMCRFVSKVSFKRRISLGVVVFTILNIALLYRTTDNFVTRIQEKVIEYYKFFEGMKERKNFLNTLKIDAEGAPGIYVVVIGESQNKTHMGAYGYNKNTTPWLSSMKHNTRAIIFENAYSCHVQTAQVLSYALTAKNQYNNIEPKKAVSFIEAANAAGYNTYWISNQDALGDGNSTPITIIAGAAKNKYFVKGFTEYTKYDNHYDEDILKYLDKISYDDKVLVIIHLMGSHWIYSERYPKKFDLYGEGKRNAYDNSIFYNDYIMGEIYKKVSAFPNFKGMVYFSDHSEGINYGLEHNTATFVFDMTYIPFYMLFSESYIEENPEIFNSLKSRQNSVFTNDLIFNTMLSVMRIKIDNIYEPENDLTSADYDDDISRFKTIYGERGIIEDKK